jgi:Hydantoinase B/oxoprolinase
MDPLLIHRSVLPSSLSGFSCAGRPEATVARPAAPGDTADGTRHALRGGRRRGFPVSDLHRAGRLSGRLQSERPLRRRHAPAGLLPLQADLPRQGAGGLGREHRASARRGRQDPGRQWLRRHGDLPGGAPHPRRQARRAGGARRAGLRDDRPQRARPAPGAGRRALPGGRVLHRRARLSQADGPARRRALQRLHDHAARPAERLAGSAIAKMPDGTYEFTDWIDDDGIDPDPIPVKVAITVTGDRLIADFTGSASQVRGAINSPLPFTKRIPSCPSPSRRAASPGSASPMRCSARWRRLRPTASSPVRWAATPA